MTLETANDRAAFLADFGTDVTGAASFRAIYDHQYLEIGDMVGNQPVLACPYRYPVSSLETGDALEVESTDYTVIRIENDGTGWCLVILQET